jgi:WD40 repeat protein
VLAGGSVVVHERLYFRDLPDPSLALVWAGRCSAAVGIGRVTVETTPGETWRAGRGVGGVLVVGRRGGRVVTGVDGSRWGLVAAVLGGLGVVVGTAAQTVDKQPGGRTLWVVLTVVGGAVGLPAAVGQSRWWQQRSVRRDEQRRNEERRTAELRAHFLARGRGVVRPDWRGSYFTGRTRALGTLIGWLNGEAVGRVRVVVGQPGSGKSAVLGRLMILADPVLRRREPDMGGLPLVTGRIDCAVFARGKDGGQILATIADAAGLGAVTLEELTLAVQAGRRGLTVLIDGLDEAVAPDRVARELVVPLLDSSPDVGIRLLLGIRPHLLPVLGVGVEAVVDLDAAAYFERADLVQYAHRCLLLGTDQAARSPYRADPVRARRTAEAIAERAGRVFLVAQLTARAFAQEAAVVELDRSGWRERFPTTVGAAMEAYLGAADDSDRVRELLAPLAFAEGSGLPAGPLWASLATALGTQRYEEQDVRRLLYRSTALDLLQRVRLGSGEERYLLFHQALAEHLRSVVPHPAPERVICQTLIDSVPRSAAGGRMWVRAGDYVREYLPMHAVRSGHFEELVDDAGFLLAAAADQVLRAMSMSGARPVRRAAAVYRAAVHHLRAVSAATAASQLELCARQQGHDRLADGVVALGLARPWSTRWTRCRAVHPHQVLGRHDGEVKGLVVLDIGGRSAVVTTDSEGTVGIWDVEKGTALCPLIALPGGEGNAVAAMRSAGDLFVVVGGDGGVWALDPALPRPVPRRIGDAVGVRVVAAADGVAGTVIVVGGFDGRIGLCDPSTATAIGQAVPAHRGGVQALAIARLDGRPVMVSGGSEGTVAIWDLANGAEIWRVDSGLGEPVAVLDVLDTTDGLAIMVGSLDGTIRVWRPPGGELRNGGFFGADGSLSCMSMATVRGGLIVITGSVDGAVRAWDAESGALLGGPLAGHEGWVSTASATERGERTVVVTGGLDGTVRAWDLTDADLLADNPDAHQGEVTCVSLVRSHGRHLAVSGGTDGTVRMWDAATGAPSADPIAAHERGVRAVATAVLNDRLVIVSGGLDGTVLMWDAGTEAPTPLATSTHGGTIRALAWAVAGAAVVVVSGGDDGIRRWDLTTGGSLGDPIDTDRQVRALAVANLLDRPVILAGGDGGIRRWDLTTGGSLGDPIDTDRQVRALAVANLLDRPVILAGGDGGIRRWDLTTGRSVGDPIDTDRQVRALAVANLLDRPVIAAGDDRGLSVYGPAAHIRIELGFTANCLALAPPADVIVGAFHGLFRIHTNRGHRTEADT